MKVWFVDEDYHRPFARLEGAIADIVAKVTEWYESGPEVITAEYRGDSETLNVYVDGEFLMNHYVYAYEGIE